jgi:glucose-6-phosphate isomerase
MTTDLSERSGLPVALDTRSGRLELGAGVTVEETAVRDIAAAREVYAEPTDGPPLYFMANGLLPTGEPDPEPSLRYELTALRPGMVGPERVKTMGHVHAPVAAGRSHPELYEVLVGNGAFPLFRPATDSSGPWECVVVEAGPGQRFVIPPGWHHLAINVGSQAMLFADIVARDVQPDYTIPRAMTGAPVRVGDQGAGWNRRYDGDSTLARVAAPDLPIPVALTDVPLYPQFAADASRFRFLTEPDRGADAWSAFDERVAEPPKIALRDLPEV